MVDCVTIIQNKFISIAFSAKISNQEIKWGHRLVYLRNLAQLFKTLPAIEMNQFT